MVNNNIKTLTKRQMQVLRARAVGQMHKEIAYELGISHKTVDKHLRDIHARTGCRTYPQLIHFALHKRWVRNIYNIKKP